MGSSKKKLNTTVVKCTHCFKSVSVPSRMAIYHFLLKNGGVSVGEIVAHVGLTQPTVSYHLKEMRHSGILHSKRDGKEVHYFVSSDCPHHKQQCVMTSLQFPEG